MTGRRNPVVWTLVPIAGLAGLGVWMAVRHLSLDPGLAYFISINLVTYPVWMFDKRQARRGGFRIPEWTLHALSLAGGGLAAIIAMRRIRHKTRKRVFRLGHPALAALGLSALGYWMMR